MTGWGPERIPIFVAPLPGEALDSYLGAYARRLRCRVFHLLEMIGLAGSRASTMTVKLTAGEAKALSRATGVAESVLRAMTLAGFDGLAVTILPDRRRLGRPPAWRFGGSRTRFCPGCLAVNGVRGPIEWRLPWTFACPIHQVLLLDFCPACHQSSVPWGIRWLGPTASQAGCCIRDDGSGSDPGDRRRDCGADLRAAPTTALPEDGLVLDAERRIRVLMASDDADRPTVMAELQQVYALARRAVRGLHTVAESAPTIVHQVVAECGGRLPEVTDQDVGRDAHNAALGTTVARIALDAAHPDREAVFDWLVEADRTLIESATRLPIGSIADRWAAGGPELVSRVLARLDAEFTLSARLRYGTASRAPTMPDRSPEHIIERARQMPAMLWPSWTLRLLPRPTDPSKLRRLVDQRMDAFRRGCVAFALLPGALPTVNLERAAPLLGNYSLEAMREAITRMLPDQAGLTPLVSALYQLARALDEHGSPIDYARRRAVFDDSTVSFDEASCRRLFLQQGWNLGSARRIAVMRWYVLALLTGEHHPAPAGSWSAFGWHFTTFRMTAPPPLRAFLRDQARVNLDRHAISEPVSWEPPGHWAYVNAWPGVEAAGIDLADFTKTLAASKNVNDAASALGLAGEHVRLLCELSDVGTTIGTPNGRPNMPGREKVLEADQLRELYVDQRLAPDAIAKMASCSSSLIIKLLQHDGIAIRGHPRRYPNRPGITREWLHKRYVEDRCDLNILAAEQETNCKHLIKLLNEMGIPRRKSSMDYSSLAHLDLPEQPSAAIQAVARGP